MLKIRIARLLGLVAVLGTLLTSLTAQLTTGTVQGTVQDPSGAVVPAVELSLLNINTNLTLTQQSGSVGAYIFSNVPPGTYRLRAKLQNFKTSEISGIPVEVNRNTVIDVTIQPGDLTQKIEVSAAAENIDTQSSVVRTNVGSRMITELPSGSRNPLAFAEMAPGVNMNTSSLTSSSQLLGSSGMTANVSGSRQQQNTFYLDGADNSSVRRNEGLQMPNVEAIQEVQVVTNTNSAEYGKQPGGYFNVITKSGTNALHGSGFFYFRDPSLNANDWQRNSSGLARVDTQLRQWGGTAGGPIKRDKTFFFGSFQRFTDQAVVTSSTYRYPTQQMLAGNFSAFTGQLYNPVTNQPIPNNNLAAAGLIDPVAQKIGQTIFPTVANLGDKYIYQFATPPRSNEFLGKVDHNLTANQRVTVSYFGMRGSTVVLPDAPREVPNVNFGANQVAQNTLSGRHTWTLNPRTILETQFSFARFGYVATPDPTTTGRSLATFGGNWPAPVNNWTPTLPNFDIAGGPDTANITGGDTEQSNLRIASTLGRTTGNHNLRFGVEIQRSSMSRIDRSAGVTFFETGKFSNQGNPVQGLLPNEQFARSFADFMMGWTDNFQVSGVTQYSIPVWGYFGFAQDQWRISRTLTVNYGLRYEIWGSFHEKDGRAGAFVQGHKSNQFPNAPLNMAFDGDSGIPAGFIKQDRTNFAPRVGLAWDVFGDNRTVLRGGYGMYYAFPGAQIRLFTTENFPMTVSLKGITARISNPWLTSVTPQWNSVPVPFPDDSREWVRTTTFNPPFPKIVGFDPSFTTPISHQWNLSVEREIRNGFTVNVGYVGNVSRSLLDAIPFNYARYQNLPNGTPPSAASTNIQARTAFPDYGVTSIMIYTHGVADYHSLQASASLRLGGLSSRFTYVYARDFGNGGGSGFGVSDEDPVSFTTSCDNPANPAGEYGRRSRLHTFRAFYSYPLPFLKNDKGWAGRILGRWQVSGVTSIFSGSPVNVILGYDANLDGISNRPQDRPDLVAPIQYTGGSAQQQMAGYFAKTSFARPVITLTNTWGNLMRNALYAPGTWNTDVALLKNFEVRENMRIQVRAEAYNWLNHPNLDAPDVTMSDSDFGKILTKSGNRTMQMGVVLRF